MNSKVGASKPLLNENMQNSDLKNPANKWKLIYLVADFACFILLTTPLWLFNLTDRVPRTQRGFFCGDDTIKYPFNNNLVESSTLFAIGIFATVLAMIIIESFHFFRRRRQRGFYHPLALLLYRSIGYFVVGASVNQFMTDILKVSVGRLRPHFMDVCQPDIACTADNMHVYITNATCSRTSYPGKTDKEFETMQKDMRLSFPSGHSSFAMYVGFYFTLYLEFRSHWAKIQLLRHLFQIGAMGAALWTCATRLIDHKHHPTDVLFGGVLGMFIAYLFNILFQKSIARYRRDCDLRESGSHALLPMSKQSNGGGSISPDVERNTTTGLNGRVENRTTVTLEKEVQ